MSESEIVKIKRSDLKALMDANTEAYNLLDNISTYVSEVETAIKRSLSVLEDVPSDMSDLIIEDEDEPAEEPE